MKIGIDAKWYFNGPPSGRIVVRNLFNALIRINTEHEITMFLDQRFSSEPFPITHPKLHLEYIWAGNNMLSNVFVLPLRAKALSLDAVVFQNFPSLIGTFKKIAYIHDVLFLSHPQYYTFIERLYFSSLRFLSNRSDLIITVSNTEKDRLIQHGYNRNIETVYHGVLPIFKPLADWDPEFIRGIKEKFSLPDEFLLFVGRVNVRKNLINLLKALSHTKSSTPLVIVGSKDWKSFDLEAMITHDGLKGRILLTGFLSGEELAAIFSLGTLFCFPSYAESFGLPPLEAMASGVPVIVSDRTCLPEICGTAGNYIDPDNPKGIASMIDRLLSDDELYTAKRNAGLEQAKKFTWEKSAQRMLDILKSLS